MSSLQIWTIVHVQLVHNFAYFLRLSPASFACSGTGMLHRRVTLDDDIKDLLCEFEGSIFQSRTSHTCSKLTLSTRLKIKS